MTFLNPIGLLGLLSLPVVLILHLLRERKRRHLVSNLSLWAFLEAESRSPRFRRIPIHRLLLLDLLIAALLSLAWAQPSIVLAQATPAAHQRILLLDVSTSMRAREGAADRLTLAKRQAAALLNETSSQDVVTVITFGQRAAVLADSRTDGLSRLTEQVQSARAGETASEGAGGVLREALALGQAALDPNLPAQFVVLTDGSFAAPNLGDFPHPLEWRFLGQSAENQAVINLTVTPLGEGRVQVFGRLANFSGSDASREVVLRVDGREVDRSVVDLPADSTIPRVWQVAASSGSGSADADQPGAVSLTLEGNVTLTSGDWLAEDDTAAIGFQPGGEIRVALVAENPAALQQAVQAVPGAQLTVIPPEEYPAAVQANGSLGEETAPFDLTIFRGYLPSTWPARRVLVVEPPQAADTESPALAPGAEALLANSTREIPGGVTVRAPNPNRLVEGVDFSGVRWSRAWEIAAARPAFTPLLQAGEVPLLLEGRVGEPSQTRVTVLLADLGQGNFTRHPAFPILIANLVETSRQAPLPPSLKTGDAAPLPAAGSYQSVRITPPGGTEVVLEQEWPEAWQQTLDPGLYRFRLIQVDGEAVDFASGVNAGDPQESDLRVRPWTTAVGNQGGASGTGTEGDEQPLDLRPWLLGAAILMLLVEATLAWRR